MTLALHLQDPWLLLILYLNKGSKAAVGKTKHGTRSRSRNPPIGRAAALAVAAETAASAHGARNIIHQECIPDGTIVVLTQANAFATFSSGTSSVS
ncbi:unnamed protein product, partial [Iphiclides podalirius]